MQQPCPDERKALRAYPLHDTLHAVTRLLEHRLQLIHTAQGTRNTALLCLCMRVRSNMPCCAGKACTRPGRVCAFEFVCVRVDVSVYSTPDTCHAVQNRRVRVCACVCMNVCLCVTDRPSSTIVSSHCGTRVLLGGFFHLQDKQTHTAPPPHYQQVHCAGNMLVSRANARASAPRCAVHKGTDECARARVGAHTFSQLMHTCTCCLPWPGAGWWLAFLVVI